MAPHYTVHEYDEFVTVFGPAPSIEGFHVASYQANFASHDTCDHHVGFLLAWHSIGKHNKMSRYFLFSLYHNTKLQLSDKNISTHTWWKF